MVERLVLSFVDFQMTKQHSVISLKRLGSFGKYQTLPACSGKQVGLSIELHKNVYMYEHQDLIKCVQLPYAAQYIQQP